MFASFLEVRVRCQCRFVCPRRYLRGVAAMEFVRRECSSRSVGKNRRVGCGGGLEDMETRINAVSTVPGDSLFTLEGLCNYRESHLRPLLIQKRHALQQMTEIKTRCEAVALRYANYYAAGLFVLLTAQAVTLFYWVYFLFDWNLVEPMTYLLGYGGVWVAIACYATTQRDFTYEACMEMIAAYYISRLYRQNNFDLQLWQRLTAEVRLLEERLRGLEGF
ncbi:hypothetical protein TcCL_NonESM06542 [Trypanosoma cruzi]|uniref:Calcium uniporter protein C-terminal domain-containing protein n=1 Tax=Trypanosoma cruzi (strain CL Brener) TaxID=353153 RepID=Q4DYG3_TRYCC|nr:hypothetical protein, conserved [Trypanosoma cruzi]EAN97585.1 hypothetical protein, conserved [Trypanosoma cruzi]RNC43788.1 hypothetical protein TcCL_NonESM06542 [Trypanosoma cruzi]|eukprot:XP_819436.1 hypothetical protein [Trypanosoma cruzi strain CL Brener]